LYFVFCVSVKVKLTVPLLCVCVHSAWKGHPQNDLYCVGRDVKPYSLTHWVTASEMTCNVSSRTLNFIRLFPAHEFLLNTDFIFYPFVYYVVIL